LFSGFGWVSLAHSQYKNLWVIQISDLTGMLGVSFLIVMVNLAIKEKIILPKDKKQKFLEWVKGLAVTLSILFLTLGYGLIRLSQRQGEDSFKVAVIQGNISQDIKWEKSAWPFIMKIYRDLTEQASRDHPDFIIWPETAYPGFLWESPQLFQQLKEWVRQIHIPLLTGIVTKKEERYFNSATLLNEEGNLLDNYHKLHLVPFGEFIPLRRFLPFLTQIVPIDDFTSGENFTVFDLSYPKMKRKFSVLICFEDTFAGIARQFVLGGAELLINITNDAWFKDTSAPFLHLQSSVFRAVENRRTVIRSANTGVSCFINPSGMIERFVQDAQLKKTFVRGFAIHPVGFHQEKTFYTRFGDIFVYFCFGCLLVLGIRLKYYPPKG